jgi:hypothetical protein
LGTAREIIERVVSMLTGSDSAVAVVYGHDSGYDFDPLA